MVKLSAHFALEEFVPDGFTPRDVPQEVVTNLAKLALLLDRVRDHFGVAVQIHSGWRPAEVNERVGGVVTSDHPAGRAADFHVWPTAEATWEDNTLAAYRWVVENLGGEFGQAILEDHRAHESDPKKLWIHLSLPTEKHPGAASDPNRLLTSDAPHRYAPWVAERFDTA